MIAALLAAGHGWFDWTQYWAVIFAALFGLVGVILAGVLLWRGRPEAKVGPARFIRGNADDVVIAIALHVVAGGHWVLKSLDVSFMAEGSPIADWQRLDNISDLGVGELRDELLYQMPRPKADIEIDVSLKFRHGGKPATYQGSVAMK